MEKVTIEVCPRSDDGQYHACIAGNTGAWGCGSSVETAVVRLISAFYEKFKASAAVAVESTHLTKPPTTTRAMLRKVMATITEVEVEIRFLPSITR